MNSSLKARKEKGAQHEEVCQSRFKKRFTEKQRLEHEDSLKFFQVWEREREYKCKEMHPFCYHIYEKIWF